MKTFNKFTLIIIMMFNSTVAMGQWNLVENFPVMTDGSFSFVIDGKAYVNGGLANNNFYVYDESLNKWTKLADVPSSGSKRAWAFAFSVNGKGYVAGGSYETATDLESSLWEYDPDTDNWTEKAEFPGGKRDGGYSFAIGDKGYIGGGFDGQYLHNDLYEYDPALDKWTQLANFPVGPVIFPASFVINSKAYVGTADQGGTEIQQFWEYDPLTDIWNKKADFAGEKRQTAVGFTIGNKGYIGGGMSEYTINRTDFWVYDPQTNEWTNVDDADFPDNHTAWSTGFVIGNNAYYGLGVEFPAFTFSNQFYKMDFSHYTGLELPEKKEGIKIYPMPAEDRINIEIRNSNLTKIILYGLAGEEIQIFEEVKNQIDISALTNGVYLLKIVTPDNIYTEKIFKY